MHTKEDEKTREQHLSDLPESLHELSTAATGSEISTETVGESPSVEKVLAESEATLRSFYDSNSMMMGVIELLDDDVLHISVNQATARFFSTTPEAMQNKRARQLGASEQLSRTWIEAYRESERTGLPARFEYVLEYKKQKRILFATVTLIDKTANGRSRFSYIVEDITERKQEEQRLKASEEKFSRVFHSSPLPMSIRRLDSGQFIDVNESYLRTIGSSREEVIGRIPSEIGIWVDPTDQQQLSELINQRKPIHNMECRFRWRSSAFGVVLLTAEYIEIDGQTCILTILNDITPRKRAEADREKLIAQLQQALDKVKLLSGFLPICASCKKIRDDQGYWQQIEEYIRDHSEAEFSHGICPQCAENLYRDMAGRKNANAD